MKLLICFAIIVVAVQALTDEQKKKLEEISKECKAQSGVSQELIDKARTGDLVDDPKLKTQMLCVAKKTGLGTDSGEIDLNILKSKLKKVAPSDEEVEKLVKKCAVKKGTPEETTFEAFKCLRKEKPNFSVVD